MPLLLLPALLFFSSTERKKKPLLPPLVLVSTSSKTGNMSKCLHSPQSGSRCSHGGERKDERYPGGLNLSRQWRHSRAGRKSLVCVTLCQCVCVSVCVCLQSPSLSLLANTKSLLEGGAEREEEETGAHSVPQGRAKWGGPLETVRGAPTPPPASSKNINI